MGTNKDEGLTREFMELCLVTDGEGQFVYQSDQVRSFLLRFAVDYVDAVGPEKAPESILRSLAGLFDLAGIGSDEQSDPSVVADKICAFFQRHPIPESLWKSYARMFRRHLLSRDDGVERSRIDALLDQRRTSFGSLLGEKPKGALSLIGVRAQKDI